MALDALVDSYLTHLRVERALSPHTIAAYGRDLGKFLEFAEKQAITELAQLDLSVISSWLGSLSKSGLGPRSSARHLSAARGLMKFLIREGELADDPTRLAPRPLHQRSGHPRRRRHHPVPGLILRHRRLPRLTGDRHRTIFTPPFHTHCRPARGAARSGAPQMRDLVR